MKNYKKTKISNRGVVELGSEEEEDRYDKQRGKNDEARKKNAALRSGKSEPSPTTC